MTTHDTLRRLTQAYDLAARRHSGQTRKGAAGEPYVNHVADVASRLARSPNATEAMILAAVLHDTVEDTDTTLEEIEQLFGPAVAGLVAEVTDDKGLSDDERKRRQVEDAPHKSDGAKRIKLADKASNLTALVESPPHFWEVGRKRAYVAWARDVAAGLRGVDPVLDLAFEEAAARAEAELGR
jgi:(p)ppGpp synthase/HD superfamily hydrolase